MKVAILVCGLPRTFKVASKTFSRAFGHLNAPTVILKAAQFYEEISRQIIDTNNTAKILC